MKLEFEEDRGKKPIKSEVTRIDRVRDADIHCSTFRHSTGRFSRTWRWRCHLVKERPADRAPATTPSVRQS